MQRLPILLTQAPLFFVASAAGCCDSYARLEPGDPPPITLFSPALLKVRAERVVLISIDGCRPDAIDPARAPALTALRRRGSFTPKAETIRPSITLPSHTSMPTGLDFDRHGVDWNNYRPGCIVHPTVFSILAQRGMHSAMLFSKDKFHFLANPACVSWIYGPPVPHNEPAKQRFRDSEELKREEEVARQPVSFSAVPDPGEARTTAA